MPKPDTTIQPTRLKNLFRRLVDIYSPSGKEEEIVVFLKEYLTRKNLSVTVQAVDDNRYNLIVLPAHTQAQMAFIGHVDTVVAYDLDQYGYEEEGDRIRGLGTADMKGGCAAMIEAFTAIKDLGHSQFPSALCLLVGEEEEGDGARKLVKDYRFPWAILGEPTDVRPCLSHYGYLEIHVSTIGRRVHASLANRAENPVEILLRLMLRISHYMEKERPDLVYNIRDLYSSQAGFAVPERCEAWIDIHLPPSAPVGQILTELEEIVSQKAENNNRTGCKLSAVTIDSGYELPEKGWMIKAMRSTYAEHHLPWMPKPFVSHSDANQLWAAGVKPILLGPGQLEKAHTPDESVSFQQVCLAAQLYVTLLLRMIRGH